MNIRTPRGSLVGAALLHLEIPSQVVPAAAILPASNGPQIRRTNKTFCSLQANFYGRAIKSRFCRSTAPGGNARSAKDKKDIKDEKDEKDGRIDKICAPELPYLVWAAVFAEFASL